MTPRALGYGIAALIMAGILGYVAGTRHASTSATTQIKQADKHHEAAIANAAAGAIYDQQANQQQAVIASDSAAVSRLRAEVARLRQTAPTPLPHPPVPSPDPQPVPPPLDLAPLVSKQDELITALTKEIMDLKSQVNTLTLARDSWRSSAKESAKESIQLRAALAAQAGAMRAERWRGRLEGLVLGIGSGYATGRFR